MKAKYINNRPVQFSSPENVSIGDIIEQNNPPRGVNFWEVLSKTLNGNILTYTVKMLSGSAFTGSVYVMTYAYKYPEKKLPTHWFYQGMVSDKQKV